jgi:hypothetical protein
MRTRVLTIIFLTGCLLLSLGRAQPRNADQWYAAGRTALSSQQFAAAERAFTEAVKRNPTAANWRWLGEARVGLADYDGATSAFGSAILKYRASGDTVTANALENRVAPYRQQGDVYLLNQPVPKPRVLARLEPSAGLMLGSYVDERGIDAGDNLVIPQRLGTGLAVYFRYHQLIDPSRVTADRSVFPSRMAAAARRVGGALHIALEPSMPLEQVTERIVTPFAMGVRDSGLPVFVRFASEFNDPSNTWSKNPQLYKEKFRLVASILHRIAPNAATVWMPMASRFEVLDQYYPGAEYVDWAGVSLYSTPFSNGDRQRSNWRVSPLDVLEKFYAKYADRHPIQVSEYASSSETLLTEGVDYSAFAVQKMQMLYWGAFLRLPRLKNINWLDVDMIRTRYLPPGRAAERRNNYALFANTAKLETFKSLLTEPYFLRGSLIEPNVAPIPLPTVLKARPAGLEIAAWVKTFDPNVTRVRYSLDGLDFAVSSGLPYRAKLPVLRVGQRLLTLRAFNAAGKLLLTRSARLEIR